MAFLYAEDILLSKTCRVGLIRQTFMGCNAHSLASIVFGWFDPDVVAVNLVEDHLVPVALAGWMWELSVEGVISVVGTDENLFLLCKGCL